MTTYLTFASFAAAGDSGGGKSSDFALEVAAIDATSPILPDEISSPPFKSLAERPRVHSTLLIILFKEQVFIPPYHEMNAMAI